MDFCNDQGGRLYEPKNKNQFTKLKNKWKNKRGKDADSWLGISNENAGQESNVDGWVYR